MQEFRYEKQASRGEALPEDLTFAETYMFIALRHLYADYRAGYISKETAKADKLKLIKEFARIEPMEKTFERTTKMWVRIAEASIRFNKERSIEAAEAFHAAVYGFMNGE